MDWTSPLRLDEAERVSGRIYQNPPFLGARLCHGDSRPEFDRGTFAAVEVMNVEVDVCLL